MQSTSEFHLDYPKPQSSTRTWSNCSLIHRKLERAACSFSRRSVHFNRPYLSVGASTRNGKLDFARPFFTLPDGASKRLKLLGYSLKLKHLHFEPSACAQSKKKHACRVSVLVIRTFRNFSAAECCGPIRNSARR